MSTLSTHVLDTSVGKPAAGITVTLERNGAAIKVGLTNADGRLGDIQENGAVLDEGDYALRFAVAEYFEGSGLECFYPQIVIHFRMRGGMEHYHVPLLVSPFGYSTYRGS
ncbi:MAG: hydroxyisourate hydrolase [Gemmatimonadota bacterium]|nr:hydroxyisourate hydrolase [Gemmatimonadota bacterium]